MAIFYKVFDVTFFIGMYILRTNQFKSIAGARPHNSSIKRGVFCLDNDAVSFYTSYSIFIPTGIHKMSTDCSKLIAIPNMMFK
jgi:hypothetical protein